MIYYILIMSAFLVLSLFKQTKTNRKFITIFCGLILTILMGFKNVSVGNDTNNYIYFFKRLISLNSWIDPMSRFESGYQIYCKLLGFISNSYRFLFIVTAIICITCVSLFIYKFSKNPAYSFFLFVGLRFFYFFLSGLRQSIAVSLILLSYISLKEGKIKKYLFYVLIASTFHRSALIFLLSYPISRLHINKKNILYMLSCMLLGYILFSPILNLTLSNLPTYYSHYLETDAFNAGNLANYIDFIIKVIFICIAIFFNYTRKNTENITVEETNMFILIMASGLSLIATRASMLDRLEQYYWIFSVAIIPDIIRKIKIKSNKEIMYFFITIFVFLYNIIILILRPEWNMVVPYMFGL